MRTKKAIELSQETMVPVYVGLDYHSETIRVCLMDENGDVIVNRNARNEVGAVVDLVKSHHGIVVEVAIEACCGSADFAWELFEATEWKIRLAHPSAVNRLKEGPDKTDAGDAWHLANLLRVGYLPEVWLADEATGKSCRDTTSQHQFNAESVVNESRLLPAKVYHNYGRALLKLFENS